MRERLTVRLSKLVTKRPDGKGGLADCDAWDNALLLCDCIDKNSGAFPLLFGCFAVEETRRSHALLTDALRSQANGGTVEAVE